MKMFSADEAHARLKPIHIKPKNKGLFTKKAHAAGKSVGEYANEEQHAKGKLGMEARFAKNFGGK